VTDLVFEPLIDLITDCLCAAVAGHPTPPGQCGVRVGDHMSVQATLTSDECCPGVAWVRMVSASPTNEGAFPNPSDDPQVCAPPIYQWVLHVELGIARCVPVGDIDHLPDCTSWTGVQLTGLLDAKVLRQAICCVQANPLYRDLVIDGLEVAGPDGACTRTTLNVAVKVVGCDEC
jgi:hypothetical protein